jgi:hypothetical protein
LLIRGQRVMLDRVLAALYGVTTGNLNEAVQRNTDRFSADFMFQLTDDETEDLIFQFARSKQRGGSRFNPYGITLEGVAILSSVPRNPRAVQVNVAFMRVFVRLRETLALHSHNAGIRTLFEAIHHLTTPVTKSRHEIGFHVKEDEIRNVL